MTPLQGVGVLLIVLGVVYLLMYVGWLPRPRRRASAAGIMDGTPAGAGTGTGTGTAAQPAKSRVADSRPSAAAEPPRALTLAWVQGTYLSTTMAITRQERVAAAGLDGRTRATMVVDDSTVRWERAGLGEVRVAGPRILGVSLRRSMADMLLGQAHVVLVSWRAENATNGKDADRYVTGFLPRARADSAALVSAVQRLMTMGASIDDTQMMKPDGTP